MKDAYGDEVPDSEDACPNSDVRPTVFVGTCNAIVPTISFRTAAPWRTIADAAARSKNHAAFVSGVAHLTNDWVRQGIITGAQKGAIQSCAGKAKLP